MYSTFFPLHVFGSLSHYPGFWNPLYYNFGFSFFSDIWLPPLSFPWFLQNYPQSLVYSSFTPLCYPWFCSPPPPCYPWYKVLSLSYPCFLITPVSFSLANRIFGNLSPIHGYLLPFSVFGYSPSLLSMFFTTPLRLIQSFFPHNSLQ